MDIQKEYETIRERVRLNTHPRYCKLVKQFPNGSKLYKMGFWFNRVSVVLSNENGIWHLSLSGRNKKPTERQIFIAQSELVPIDVTMRVKTGIGIDPFCVHLFSVEDSQ